MTSEEFFVKYEQAKAKWDALPEDEKERQRAADHVIDRWQAESDAMCRESNEAE